MMKGLTLVVLATAALGGFGPQDPVTTLPGAYATQFENEWVRVVRVHYAPHAKLPAHAHNALPAAYVYLNDGGPVLFKHIGTAYGAATRPATKAGGFRVFRGIDEIHEVENTSELPSHFLRVEFKTDPKEVSTLKGRFYREVVTPGENLEKVQFENDQVRITRLVFASGRPMRVAAAASEPTLLIALRDAKLRTSDGSKTALGLGHERWLPTGVTVVFENDGNEPSEFLRFDLKTGPVRSFRQEVDTTNPSLFLAGASGGGYLNGRIAEQQQLARAAGRLLIATLAGTLSYKAEIMALAVLLRLRSGLAACASVHDERPTTRGGVIQRAPASIRTFRRLPV